MDTSRYADLFLTESREHLSAINHSLLELERTQGGADAVGALFRAVHTVKGMSATMGYTAVADLSHELESLLDGVRRGDRAVTPSIMDALFSSADALEGAIEQAVEGRAAETDVGSILATLRALAVDPGVAHRTGASDALARGAQPADMSGAGVLVRITIASGTPLRGVRAFIALQRARALGEVSDVNPSVEALQSESFDREFSLRLLTAADAAEIQRTVLAAGDIERVDVGPPGPAAAVAATPIASSLGTGGGGGGAVSIEALSGSGGRGAGSVTGAALDETVQLRQQRHIRIDLRRLDSLMNLIGELVITRGRLTQLSRDIADSALDESVAQASRLISDLQDEIMTSRMVPVWQVFDRFPRLVRDAARALGKDVDFSVEGKEIELDRSMLDEIGDPIVHLLRNAVDHGIETPAARRAAGKPPAGRLSLSAMRDRSAVLIRVSDDGKGIDRAKVLRRAKELALVDAQRTELGDDDLIRLISRPGFSTAEKVTDLSGRGVGIDAVQTRVRALGGSLEIRSMPGQGTTVIARLPLTLAIVRALLARVEGETYALPMTHVNETVELEAATLRTVKGREVLVLRDDVVPLLRLRTLMHLPAATDRSRQVIVLEIGDRRAGLVVDELSGQQEIVVKQFDAVRDGVALFSGATILGDGAPALIVDVGSLL